MFISNATFYYSQDRVINPVTGSQIECSQSGDLIVFDYQADTYVNTEEKHGQMMMLTVPE